MKNIMKKAHEITREIKKEFPEVDYKFQLGLCISYLCNLKKEEKEMVELKGSEKQIKWCKEIIKRKVAEIDASIEQYKFFIKRREDKGEKAPRRYSRKITELEALKEEILSCDSCNKIINEYANIEIC